MSVMTGTDFTHISTTQVRVTKTCCVCDRKTELVLDKQAVESWALGGALVQDAFPALLPEQRETLISGLHSQCWDQLFAA